MAIKRGKGQRLIPLEELRGGEGPDLEPADPITAERIYERRWASTLLEHVFSRLKDEYRAAGNATLFDSLKQLLPDECDVAKRVLERTPKGGEIGSDGDGSSRGQSKLSLQT
jgi:hypothetical protein